MAFLVCANTDGDLLSRMFLLFFNAHTNTIQEHTILTSIKRRKNYDQRHCIHPC